MLSYTAIWCFDSLMRNRALSSKTRYLYPRRFGRNSFYSTLNEYRHTISTSVNYGSLSNDVIVDQLPEKHMEIISVFAVLKMSSVSDYTASNLLRSLQAVYQYQVPSIVLYHSCPCLSLVTYWLFGQYMLSLIIVVKFRVYYLFQLTPLRTTLREKPFWPLEAKLPKEFGSITRSHHIARLQLVTTVNQHSP
jgi:hypothetical protein